MNTKIRRCDLMLFGLLGTSAEVKQLVIQINTYITSERAKMHQYSTRKGMIGSDLLVPLNWPYGGFRLPEWGLFKHAHLTKSPTVLQGRERLHYKGYIYHTDLSLLSTLGLLLWLCATPDQLHWECSLRWSGGPHQYGHFLSEGTRGWSACTVLNTPSWSTAFWAPGRWSGGVRLATDIMNQIKGHRTEI